jgi:hypothetical protein
MPEERELIAYCGLYCGDCYSYKGKIADLSRDLRKELRQEKFSQRSDKMSETPFFAAFKNYKECYELLGSMVRFRCKRTCRGNGGPPGCKIRDCCRKKNIEGCWECNQIESCRKLDFLKDFHEDAHFKNLAMLKKSGVEKFLKSKRQW